tara:strand:- start:865 stop:1419 length:555 start_codon:yes stop_codon:yes gene_type:complete
MPLVLDVITIGIGPISEKFRQLGGGDPQFRDEAFRTILNELGKTLVHELKLVTPRGVTRRLAEETHHEVSVIATAPDEVLYELAVIQSTKSSGGFMYRPIVIRGRLPGRRRPPAAALLGWVKLNWHLPGFEAFPVAMKLAASIARKGTINNPYPAKAITNAQFAIQQVSNDLGQNLSIIITDID